MGDARKEKTWQDVLKERYTTPQNEVLQPWVFETQNNPAVLPETDMQAMQQCGPHVEPASSKQNHRESMDRVQVLLETVLDDDERAVIEATVIAGHSIRRASDILGWPSSTVHRLKQSALSRLEKFLVEREQ